MKSLYTASFNKSPSLYIATMRLRSRLNVSRTGIGESIHTPTLNTNSMIFLTVANAYPGERGEQLFFG